MAASNPEQLDRMRVVYDEAVDIWKRDAVPYGYYPEFGILFDRHIPWAVKKERLPESFIMVYQKELKRFQMQDDPYNYNEIIKKAE